MLDSLTTFGAYGINVAAGANQIVRNNMIEGVTGDMTGGAAFSTTFGLMEFELPVAPGHQVYHNSVNLYGLRAGTANTSLLGAGLCIVLNRFNRLRRPEQHFVQHSYGRRPTSSNTAYVSIYLPSGATSAMNLTDNNNDYFFGTDVAQAKRAATAGTGNTAGTNFSHHAAASTYRLTPCTLVARRNERQCQPGGRSGLRFQYGLTHSIKLAHGKHGRERGRNH